MSGCMVCRCKRLDPMISFQAPVANPSDNGLTEHPTHQRESFTLSGYGKAG